MESTRVPARLEETEKSRFLGKTYGWMAFALCISAAAAYFTASSEPLLKLLFGNRAAGFIGLVILEIVLVFALSASIRKIPVGVAAVGFVLYALINGMTLSSIFIIYQISSIATAFFSTAILFSVMSLWGMTTKRNLASWGRYLMMALLGVIIASVAGGLISFFTKTPLNMLDILISVAIVIIFTALTAYDSQKLLKTAEHARNTDDYKKVAILAALELYLDFINLLLALLRIFGKKK
ncbi:MAG: Bax inhibitor-1/YccA family protein [Treponema sp.]|nr:Bax inhibitor-1/YccA family protein [Treponema sp.]